MAFATVFTFLTILLIVTVSFTKMQETSSLNFTITDKFNVSFPGKFLRYRNQDGKFLTSQEIEHSISFEQDKSQDALLRFKKRGGGQPALLDLMDFSTRRVQQEQIVAPAVILRKIPKKPPTFWIWKKLLFGKK